MIIIFRNASISDVSVIIVGFRIIIIWFKLLNDLTSWFKVLGVYTVSDYVRN